MATIARCLIAFFFVASGAGKIFAFRQSSTILASIGFPIPRFFLTAIIAVEIAGGLGLLFNLWTSYVAVTLIVKLALPFWTGWLLTSETSVLFTAFG